MLQQRGDATMWGRDLEYFLQPEATNRLRWGHTCERKYLKTSPRESGVAQETEAMLLYHWVHPLDMSSPLKSTSTCNLRQKAEQMVSIGTWSGGSNTGKCEPLQGKPAGHTFPRSPLCLDRMLPPFFTATSKVLLWSSTIDTLNSNLQTHTHTHFYD